MFKTGFYLLLLIISVLIILFLFKNNSQNQQFKDYKSTNYILENRHYNLLVADTKQKWEKGLMFVKGKQNFDGMIFIFPKKEVKVFWNMNTVLDLDLYWIDEDKVIGKSTLPSIEKSKDIVYVNSGEKVDKVIEIIK